MYWTNLSKMDKTGQCPYQYLLVVSPCHAGTGTVKNPAANRVTRIPNLHVLYALYCSYLLIMLIHARVGSLEHSFEVTGDLRSAPEAINGDPQRLTTWLLTCLYLPVMR